MNFHLNAQFFHCFANFSPLILYPILSYRYDSPIHSPTACYTLIFCILVCFIFYYYYYRKKDSTSGLPCSYVYEKKKLHINHMIFNKQIIFHSVPFFSSPLFVFLLLLLLLYLCKRHCYIINS